VALPEVSTTEIPAQLVSMPMMNLTRNDWQFGQGGQRRWSFRYRLVFSDAGYEPLRGIREAQHFCAPPFLQAPGEASLVPGLDVLEVHFEGGPVVAFKVAEDGERLILRLWNLVNQTVRGWLRMPVGFAHAQRCDALERPLDVLIVDQGRAQFDAERRGIVTIALCRGPQ
jgi:alpha-mannosidase